MLCLILSLEQIYPLFPLYIIAFCAPVCQCCLQFYKEKARLSLASSLPALSYKYNRTIIQEPAGLIFYQHAVRIGSRKHRIPFEFIKCGSLYDKRMTARTHGSIDIACIARHAVCNDLRIVEILIAIDRLTLFVLDDR